MEGKYAGKKVFMVVNYSPTDRSIGVTKKISGVINALRRKSMEVYYTAYGNTGIEIYNNNDEKIMEYSYSTNLSSLQKVFRRFDLLKAARQYVAKREEAIDLLFIRWLGFDIPYLRLLKTVKRKKNAFVMVDMHSYFDGIKFSSIKGRYMVSSTKLFSSYAVRYIDTMLTEGNVEQLFGKRTIHAAIGIETDYLREHHYSGRKDEINMISVANELPYHGYDRLLRSMAEYYSNGSKEKLRINLHLVGVLSEETKRYIEESQLAPYVMQYGKLAGEQLFDIYDKANMAVGPLGQHRVGGKKGTGLKTKEYIGIGIPYFYSGEDVSIPENFPYALRVPSDERMIDFDEIIAFYQSYCCVPDVSDNMRNYARKNFSWDVITDSFLLPFGERI